MRVFLTGATGFVGSHVARTYADAGAELRLLTRSSSSLAAIEGMSAEVVVGDLREPEGLRAAITGCDALVHVAADYRLWVRDPRSMYAANVDGTRELLRIAREVGVRRVVYTSSVATMGFKTDGTIANEDSPVSLDDMIGHYKRSKFLGELEAIKAARAGQEVILLNPTTPIGAGDAKPTPTGRIVVEAALGRIPAFVDTGLNLVHVDDVAEGHIRALERGAVGERYILGGQNASLRELLADIAALAGRKAPTVSLPRAPLYPLAWAAEAVARVTGREPFVTRDALDMAAHHMFFTSAKAERELGYRARPYREALSDALAWFRAAGYLK